MKATKILFLVALLLAAQGVTQTLSPPPNFRVTSITPTSLSVAWGHTSMSRYELYLGDTLIVVTSDTLYVVGGLKPNTLYELRVRGILAAGDTTEFSTLRRYTGIEPPESIVVLSVGSTESTVQLGGKFSNLTSGQSGITHQACIDSYCENGFTSGDPGGWAQNNDVRTISGLEPAACYTILGTVRNGDGVRSGTVATNVYSLANPPRAGGLTNIGETSVRVYWGGNGNRGTYCGLTDILYPMYYVENTTRGTSKGWITDWYWDESGLTPGTYCYRVKARSVGNVETEWVDLGQVTTLSQTGVDDTEGVIPSTYGLEQNYPNPFNPLTSIKYQLPVAGHVRLNIYTVLGQEVRRLIDRSQEAAYHVVVWDGRDNDGNTLPSGVYFYRLESGGFMAMKKMIMMK